MPSTLLSSVIRSETSLRSQSFPLRSVQRIFRYGAPVGSLIEQVKNTKRCMDLARERIISCEQSGTSFASGSVFIAEQLSAGKGRFLRSWYAPSGGIWMVVALVNTLLPESSSLYSLAAGVACCETVRHFGVDARVKWVNDVQAGGRKLAGILTETMIGPRYREEYILIGIGLNVNNTDFPAELEGRAGAMSMFSQHEFELAQVTAVLLSKLTWNTGLLHFEEERRMAAGGALENTPHPIIDSWRLLSDTIGRRVSFGFNVIEQEQYQAKVIDIANDGCLIMELDDGSRIKENSGEIIYL